jgi:hypothetical protein
MKTIYAIALCLFVTTYTNAQRDEKKEHKHEKNGQNVYRDDDRISQDEKIIWAGTGINLNDKAKDAKNVPDAVMTSFREFFPNQPIDNIMKYRGLYVVTFSNSTYTTSMVYRADGTFVEARTVATDSMIPQIVKDKVRESKHDYSSNEVVMIEKPDKKKFYRFHLRKNNTDEFVVYNEQGEKVNYDY